jgi:UDP-MurNAc hydroxylase
LKVKGYRGRLEGPLPGDRLDLASGELTTNASIHDVFSWDSTDVYIDEYARRMQPHIAEVYRRADALKVDNMNAAVMSYFTRILTLSPYFNRRIDMSMCLDIEGPDGGVWVVDFRGPGVVRCGTIDEESQYRYRFHSRWLKRIIVGQLSWEDFLLSMRFSAFRDPDIYNDHLLGLLKLNEAASLRAIELYEKRETHESIVVATDDGSSYEIARFCPHAGAALDDAPIYGRTITCLNHHYRFDLDTGECLDGNCSLRTKKVN